MHACPPSPSPFVFVSSSLSTLFSLFPVSFILFSFFFFLPSHAYFFLFISYFFFLSFYFPFLSYISFPLLYRSYPFLHSFFFSHSHHCLLFLLMSIPQILLPSFTLCLPVSTMFLFRLLFVSSLPFLLSSLQRTLGVSLA